MAIHNFKKGQWVFIINQSGGGNFFIEGRYQIVKAIAHTEDRYLVRFQQRDGWETYERYVDPAAQADPYDFVSRLNAGQSVAAPRPEK